MRKINRRHIFFCMLSIDDKILVIVMAYEFISTFGWCYYCISGRILTCLQRIGHGMWLKETRISQQMKYELFIIFDKEQFLWFEMFEMPIHVYCTESQGIIYDFDQSRLTYSHIAFTILAKSKKLRWKERKNPMKSQNSVIFDCHHWRKS